MEVCIFIKKEPNIGIHSMFLLFKSLEKIEIIFIDTKVKYLLFHFLLMIKQFYRDCLICLSNKIKKYWLLKNWWQRYKCNDCHHTFSMWGIRWTYDKNFKNKIIENYCHQKTKVLDIIQHYGISSRTLIKRSKNHKKTCPQCCNHI